MTERWRKKLEGLDKQGPSDDVFERAKQGPMHHDEARPDLWMSARVVTIVAAFVVFALAISVFAIPALRMNNTPASGAGTGLMPLWPSQSADQLKQLEEDRTPNADWALDPEALTAKFAQEVMGWTARWSGAAKGALLRHRQKRAAALLLFACPDPARSAATRCRGIPTGLSSAEPSPARRRSVHDLRTVFRCLECRRAEFAQVYERSRRAMGRYRAGPSGARARDVVGRSGRPRRRPFGLGGLRDVRRIDSTLGSRIVRPELGVLAFDVGGNGGAASRATSDLGDVCDGERPGYAGRPLPRARSPTRLGRGRPFKGGMAELESINRGPCHDDLRRRRTTVAPSTRRVPTTSISPASPDLDHLHGSLRMDDRCPARLGDERHHGRGRRHAGPSSGDNLSIQVSTQTAPSGSPRGIAGARANDSHVPADHRWSPLERGRRPLGHFHGDGCSSTCSCCHRRCRDRFHRPTQTSSTT